MGIMACLMHNLMCNSSSIANGNGGGDSSRGMKKRQRRKAIFAQSLYLDSAG